LDHKGVVLGYGLGAHRQRNNRMIVMVPGSTPDEAKAMVGAIVGWPLAEPVIEGRIRKRHGASGGHLLATFRRALPGEAIGTPVKITTK
jgi:ribosomal protein L35AE/L33A